MIDAVRLVIHVFRDPGAEGYAKTHDVAADAVSTPLLAPTDFALCLDDLDLT